GSYIPDFHRSAPEIAAVEAAPPDRKRVWRPFANRILLAGAVAAIFWLVTRGEVSVIQAAKPILPWSGIFQRDKAVQVVLSDPDIAAVQNILGNNLSLSDYASHRYKAHKGMSPVMQSAFRGYGGAIVASCDTMCVLEVSDCAGADTSHIKCH